HGIDHFILGRAGMNIPALNPNIGRGSVKVLILQLSQGTAVQGVGKGCIELLYIEEVGPPANLFIGGEGNLNLPMFYLGVGKEVLHGGDDFSNARLVVGAQEGGSVGGN